MVSRKDLLHLSFYEKSPFEAGEGDDTEKVLKVTIWPGPFSYDKTPDEKKSSKNFSFSEDALDEICEWISKQHDILSSEIE